MSDKVDNKNDKPTDDQKKPTMLEIIENCKKISSNPKDIPSDFIAEILPSRLEAVERK